MCSTTWAGELQQLVADGGTPQASSPHGGSGKTPPGQRPLSGEGGKTVPGWLPGERLQELCRREGSILGALHDAGSCFQLAASCLASGTPACSHTPLGGRQMAKSSFSIIKDKGNGVL